MDQPKIIDIANAPELSDEELFRQFSDTADREILAKIFRKHMTLVFGVCKKYLGDKHSAQDATMEVFERLLTNTINTEVKNFRAYLFVLTRNHCLMKKRGEKAVMIEISDRDMEIATEVHPIDEEKHEQERALKKCLDQLKEMQKTCVERFYLEKKSYLEISGALKLTLNSVKSHIQNGKRNLKICLEASK
ncbi:MAG: sigma-70 family RNA polymerase sigma factor [Salibacteraceae bacterium]